MYNETAYEEYMRNVLGYRSVHQEQDLYYIMPENNAMRIENSELEELYPDIYRKIYPLICNECKTATMPVNKEILEKMTDHVYNTIEVDLKIETKNVRQEDRQVLRKK